MYYIHRLIDVIRFKIGKNLCCVFFLLYTLFLQCTKRSGRSTITLAVVWVSHLMTSTQSQTQIGIIVEEEMDKGGPISPGTSRADLCTTK